MLRGKTEVETLRLNNWGVGDILAGEERGKTDYILITTIGTSLFLCRWKYSGMNAWSPETGSTTLNVREWRKIGNILDGSEPTEVILSLLSKNKGN